ncbi:MAG: hypothetical protein ABSB80_03140 [Methanoregula sp.]|uniref:hypothetical protein n=1 Tax=Methanoregula sp. TaxID=2052170 RepID=UPI003D0A097E
MDCCYYKTLVTGGITEPVFLILETKFISMKRLYHAAEGKMPGGAGAGPGEPLP